MSLEANQELWNRWSEVWNGNLTLADEIIASNFVAHFTAAFALPDFAAASGSPTEVHGPDGIKQWIASFGAAFPGYSFTTEVGPVANEEYVAGRWLFQGIYQGGMPGASSAAIGKRVEFAGMDLFRVAAGKITEYWLCADTLQLLQQVGMIPS